MPSHPKAEFTRGNVRELTPEARRVLGVADNLKKQQANIPGIRPERQTAEYIDRVLTRITFGGSPQ